MTMCRIGQRLQVNDVAGRVADGLAKYGTRLVINQGPPLSHYMSGRLISLFYKPLGRMECRDAILQCRA